MSVISVENVSKLYRLGQVGSGTLKDDLTRMWYKIRGKEDPFAQVGQLNVREVAQSGGYVWALRDINLEVNQGEILGIIGRNGAGKSTLLKLLSRITAPSKGEIRMNGRIASLLEVGTGFHPDLTGRDNIYLNGTIMGMTRREIASRLDDMIDFSGCAKYIDTPVKRYSSGMKVRLGFAIAAYLECEILIVDEVLAVGDASFQKRCIDKMKDVAYQGGRTVLFVSHNLSAVRRLCSRGVLMDAGTVVSTGTSEDILEQYIASHETGSASDPLFLADETSGGFRLFAESLSINSICGEGTVLRFRIESRHQMSHISVGIVISDVHDNPIAGMSSRRQGIETESADSRSWEISCDLKDLPLNAGQYHVSVWYGNSKEDLARFPKAFRWTIDPGDPHRTGLAIPHQWGPFYWTPEWNFERV